MEPNIEFDINKVKELKADYKKIMAYNLEQLPNINWDSSKQVIELFKKGLDIDIDNVRISTIDPYLNFLDHDSDAFQVVYGYSSYLKLKYAIKNQLDCILRHEDNGKVALRLHNGKLMMPNKQPITSSPEIQACIIAQNLKGD